MTARDQTRAADADREEFAARLRQALEEGRLTLDELDDRLRQVYLARTFADLDSVVVDLPAPAPAAESQVVPSPSQVPPSRIEENPKLPGWLSMLWRLWLAVVAVNVVIWFVVSVGNGELVYPWPFWVAGPWAAVNLGLMVVFPPSRNRRR